MSRKNEPAIPDAIDLSISDIKDFQVCGLYYDYHHNAGIPKPITAQQILAERFSNTITRVASFLFYKKQSGIVPSYSALMNRWERLWFPKDTDADDIMLLQNDPAHGNLSQYSTIASVSLLKLYNDFENKSLIPLTIADPYNLPLTMKVRLNGTIDLAVKDDDRIKVYKWSASRKRPLIGDMTMDFTALDMAIRRKAYAKRYQYELYLYDLASSSPGAVRVGPDNISWEALTYWATQLEDENQFVPRRGFTAYCRGCPYDSMCKDWTDWKDKL